MTDLLLVAVVAAFFAIALGAVRACELLAGTAEPLPSTEDDPPPDASTTSVPNETVR